MQPCFDHLSYYSLDSNWVQAVILRTDEHTLEQDLELLNNTEYSRYKAFINPQHKDDFALAHILKRRVLAQYLRIDNPASLCFSTNKTGKPLLQEHALHFNLSHSQGIVALAFSKQSPCGIDIEAHNPSRVSHSLIKSSMSPTEQNEIYSAKCPSEDFYERWVIKEALVKAQGVGLRQPLSELCTVKKHYPQFKSENLVSNEQLWHLSTQGYSLAICALGHKPSFFVEYPAALTK